MTISPNPGRPWPNEDRSDRGRFAPDGDALVLFPFSAACVWRSHCGSAD